MFEIRLYLFKIFYCFSLENTLFVRNGGLKKDRLLVLVEIQTESLTSESVQGASLPLQSVDHIHGGDGLPLGVFGVGDGIPDDVLEENLENSTGLLVDESGDTLDSSTTRQPSDGGLGDALDVVSQHLTVTLGASLSQSLSSFATSSHVADISMNDPHVLCV